jgi:Flp pilus assembly protein TadG
MRIHSRIKQLCVRFTARNDGSVLPMFALSLVPIVVMIGAAVDYSRANSLRSQLQATLDSALLAGGRDGSTNWANVATDFFNGNVQPRGSSVSSPSFTLTEDRAYRGTVSAAIQTNFLGVMGIQTINVGVSAIASVGSTSGGYYCVLALNQTAQAALQLTGNATILITAPKCVLQVNSNNLDAVDLNGNTSIRSVENCFVGGVQGVGNSSISPAPDRSCKPVPDPFAAYPRPAVGPCDYTNFSLSGNKTMTLQPGVYCGGMNFNGPVKVTFAPGVIRDQGWSRERKRRLVLRPGDKLLSHWRRGVHAIERPSRLAHRRADRRAVAGVCNLSRSKRSHRAGGDHERALGTITTLFRRRGLSAPAAGQRQWHGGSDCAVTLYFVHRRYVAFRRQWRARHQQRYQQDQRAIPAALMVQTNGRLALMQ